MLHVGADQDALAVCVLETKLANFLHFPKDDKV
jgi:hypothetical protein